MQKYLGVKLIEAEPCTRIEYNNFKGWTIPEDENPTDEGYKVKYDNDYISWSPKEVFEKAYFPLAESSKKNSTSQEDVDAFIKTIDVSKVGDRTTVVNATLINGFTITKASSSAAVENYDEKMGTDICLSKIKDDIWMLLGFVLRCGLGGMK